MPYPRVYKTEIAKIVVPPLVSLLLCAAVVFGLVLPTFKNDLLSQKKELLAAVGQTAWEILDHYEKQVQNGELSLALAQKRAMDQFRELRYGAEKRNYFWLNDLQAKMLMHPYLPELNGQDMSALTDGSGNHPFREIVDMAKQGSGYVRYFWPKPDEAEPSGPKLSYVHLFEPWGWVVGTGVYLDDIEDEIRRILRKSLYSSAAILAVILLLSLYITRASIRELGKRRRAEKELRSYKDSLESLVAQRTAELQEAISNVKILSGFLPICASCKKIRGDDGYWNQIEAYIRDHSEAEFSHGICPDCAKELYPEIYKK